LPTPPFWLNTAMTGTLPAPIYSTVTDLARLRGL
jgi:hypothetical protein